MAKNKIPQIDRVFSALRRIATQTPGATAKQIARNARVPLSTVRKRIFDLRAEGWCIYTNTGFVRGEKKHYYRFDGEYASA